MAAVPSPPSPADFNSDAFRKSLAFAKKAQKEASPIRRMILEQKEAICEAIESGVSVYDIWCSFDSAAPMRCSLRLFSTVVREFDRRRRRSRRRASGRRSGIERQSTGRVKKPTAKTE